LSTYNEFSIQDVIADLSQKRIVIKTNFKVDPDSVLPTNIAFYNYDETTLEKYNLIVDNKIIYLVLEEYPKDNARYYLKIKGLKDALGRTLKTSFDDYIVFESDLKTKLQIVNPKSRETLRSQTFTINIKATEIEEGSSCKIQIASDNIFYNVLSEISQDITSEMISIDTTVEREGQIYIRARAEKDKVVGDWSEFICFNIYTISMESPDTSFLEDYLTTEDLFDDSIDLIETEIQGKSSVDANDGAFYLEFNKDIKLPDEYELDDNGYINLGTIVGFRKGLI
jgi:hypothetical protein